MISKDLQPFQTDILVMLDRKHDDLVVDGGDGRIESERYSVSVLLIECLSFVVFSPRSHFTKILDSIELIWNLPDRESLTDLI